MDIGPVWCQEPRTQFRSPMWVAATQVVKQSSALYQGSCYRKLELEPKHSNVGYGILGILGDVLVAVPNTHLKFQPYSSISLFLWKVLFMQQNYSIYPKRDCSFSISSQYYRSLAQLFWKAQLTAVRGCNPSGPYVPFVFLSECSRHLVHGHCTESACLSHWAICVEKSSKMYHKPSCSECYSHNSNLNLILTDLVGVKKKKVHALDSIFFFN